MKPKKFDIKKWINDIIRDKGGGLFLLIDPDRSSKDKLAKTARCAESAGVDAIIVGSSLLLDGKIADAVVSLKKETALPVIIFPGSKSQLTEEADGILFLILISGRNPRWLIEEQVESAPIIRKIGLSALSTAYMLIESGNLTAVQYMSGTLPIPRDKADIAIAHALASEIIGMKCLYLDAGSGAKKSVSPDMIRQIKRSCKLPIIVGGGINNIDTARKLKLAGADFLVIGTAFEKSGDFSLLKKIAEIAHSKK